MNRFNRMAMQGWVRIGPRFLPFADVATPDLPLSRLLRLSLFQVSVGIMMPRMMFGQDVDNGQILLPCQSAKYGNFRQSL